MQFTSMQEYASWTIRECSCKLCCQLCFTSSGVSNHPDHTVTTSAARVKSLLYACSRLQRGHGLFLFADESVLQRDLLSAVWQCGKAATMSALVDLPDSANPHVS
jgi:hypothetical protein